MVGYKLFAIFSEYVPQIMGMSFVDRFHILIGQKDF